MIRWGAIVAVVIGGLLAGGTPADGRAPAPKGPRLALISLTKGGRGHVRLQTVDQWGAHRRSLLDGPLAGRRVPLPFFAPDWSKDGRQLAFAAAVPKHSIYGIGPDGAGLRAIGASGTNPVFSPDGDTIAVARSRFRSRIDRRHPTKFHVYSSTTTWLVNLNGGGARRLTPWRNGLSVSPSSFSPDGSVLMVTKNDSKRNGPIALAMQIDGGATRVVARNAAEPAVSPDGSQVALISYADGNEVEAEDRLAPAGELYVMRSDGTRPRRLTYTHDRTEAHPSWDPAGQRIAYDRLPAGIGLEELFPFGDSVMQINADGTCPTKIIQVRGTAFYGPAWQPGPGREAGRIEC